MIMSILVMEEGHSAAGERVWKVFVRNIRVSGRREEETEKVKFQGHVYSRLGDVERISLPNQGQQVSER